MYEKSYLQPPELAPLNPEDPILKRLEVIREILRTVRPLARRLNRTLAEEAYLNELRPRQQAVLAALEEGPASVPQIAYQIGVRRQSVQVLMPELVLKRFIRFKANPRHRSSPLYFLTDNAREAFEEAWLDEKRRLFQTARDLQWEEVEGCLRVMTQLGYTYSFP